MRVANINLIPASFVGALAFAAWMAVPSMASGQSTDQPASQAAHPGPAANTGAQPDADLQRQLADLRARIATLQRTLEQQQKNPAAPAMKSKAPGMGGGMQGGMEMGEMGGMGSAPMAASQTGQTMPAQPAMGMMAMDKGEMGMPPAGMSMADDMMMSEMGMGAMPGGRTSSNRAAPAAPAGTGMGTMPMGGTTASSSPAANRRARSVSSLPGIPGASHLYHIGATGFFLDQPQLTLTQQQRTALNRLKERALLGRSNVERRVAEAEQQLWALTAADQPDSAKVQAKVKEIEEIRGTQRLEFIAAVGEAAKLLTPEQQGILLGTGGPGK